MSKVTVGARGTDGYVTPPIQFLADQLRERTQMMSDFRGGGGGGPKNACKNRTSFMYILQPHINPEEQIMPTTLLHAPPPDFHTFLRPCICIKIVCPRL